MDQKSRFSAKGVPVAVSFKQFSAQWVSIWPGKKKKRAPAAKTTTLEIEKEVLRGMLGESAASGGKRLSDARKNMLNEKQRASFDFICCMCFRKTCCGALSMQELANELQISSIESLDEDCLLNLAVKLPGKDSDAIGGYFRVVHPLVEKFLAAVHLIQRPLMEILEFITDILQNSDDGWTVLKILAGLSCDGGWSDSIRSTLPQLLISLLLTHLPMNEPVITSLEFFHILDCVAESQNRGLYRMMLQEFLMARTLVCRTEDLLLWDDVLVQFVVHSLPSAEHWTLHSYGSGKMPEVAELRRKVVANDSYLVAGDLDKISVTIDRDLLILTTRKEDYLRHTLVPMLCARMLPKVSPDSAGIRPPSVQVTHSAPVTSSAGASRGPSSYGFLTEEEYQSRMKLKRSTHFNMIKHAVLPHITPYSTQPVQAQYRKNDHLWFSFSRNLRHDWYETVRMTPNLPLHWVRVAQPDGSEEVEARFRAQARAQMSSGSREVVELVLLNSQLFDLIEIASPSSSEPVTIALQGNVQSQDRGVVGCDFLLDQNYIGEVQCFGSHPFDIKRDLRIGRLLPLPPKKVELGASTTLLNSLEGGEGEGQQPSGLRQRPDSKPPMSSLASFFPKHTQPYQEAAAKAEETITVSEHQIKKEAMNGFDTPGYCFFGDNRLFVMKRVYPLPDSLSVCRILREGGNGVVLEVKYGGEVYAVKKTAFRWREVLIMPKLHHKNVLKLVALVIGTAIQGAPKRRYVYQFCPRLTNDLGRSVGSFEKHCLRTLLERYQREPLLLNKVKDNFCYVAHEILLALDYLHTRPCPIIHRDVKTSNVLTKMFCECANPLVCVCRRRPDIVLSDFDASLELSKDGTLEPDPPRASSFIYSTMTTKVFHVSAVGTLGYKSPEGSMYCIGNSRDVMPPLSTKADIFGFGLVMSLLFLNQEGPKHMRDLGQLVLSVNQTVGPKRTLSREQQENLKKNGISRFRPQEIAVTVQDNERVLPLGRAKRELNDPQVISFLSLSLEPDPKRRASAETLLKHPYLNQTCYQPQNFTRGSLSTLQQDLPSSENSPSPDDPPLPSFVASRAKWSSEINPSPHKRSEELAPTQDLQSQEDTSLTSIVHSHTWLSKVNLDVCEKSEEPTSISPLSETMKYLCSNTPTQCTDDSSEEFRQTFVADRCSFENLPPKACPPFSTNPKEVSSCYLSTASRDLVSVVSSRSSIFMPPSKSLW